MLKEKKSVIFAVILTISYIIWGLTVSLTPPFYPGEAEKKGATPSQVMNNFLQNYAFIRVKNVCQTLSKIYDNHYFYF